MTHMERTTPGWCKCLMELSLWCAIATGVFFSEIVSARTALTISAFFIGLMTATWLLHWVYLRWFPFAFSWTALGGIILGVYFLCFCRDQLGDRALTVLICLPLLLVIPGAFTDRQISRFLVFLCCAGGIQILLCFVTPTLFQEKASASAILQEGEALTGSLSNEAELTAFLICTACAAAMFALWALKRLMPERSATSPGGRANLLASPGINLAFLGCLLIFLVLLILFLSPSLFAFPTFLITAAILIVMLGAKRHLSSTVTVLALSILLLAGGLNLARPLPGSGGFSGEVMQANIESLIAAESQRIHGPVPEIASSEGQRRGWDSLIKKGGWGELNDAIGSTGFLLIAVFVGLLLVEGLYSFVKHNGVQPILIAGALTGIVGIALTGLWGHFLGNPGLALLCAAFCAMVAAGGEYDEEYEEIELTA